MTPDVVIVGAGSAGCVLAARLSEDESREVLLLEAGPDYWPGDPFPEIADGTHGPSFAAAYDWGLTGCAGVDERTIPLTRGRVVGGTAAINAAFALRGTRRDYDGWAAQGNSGWGYDDLLPSLRRLERDLDFGDADYHGSDGPIPIHRRRDRPLSGWGAAVLEALTGLGQPQADDLNAPDALGVGALPNNTLDGRRISTAIGYLDRVRERPNLHVRADALVDRVLMRNGRAVGVVLADGEQIDAGEVILAAGTFLSPAILMRSGIGPAADIRSLGVDVVSDLSGVGRNLADHPAVSIDLPFVHAVAPDQPFSETVVILPDLQVISGGPFPQEDGSAVCFMAAAVMKPKSRGNMRLASLDPSAPPVIDLGYYRDDADLIRIIDGLDVIEAALGRGRTSTPSARARWARAPMLARLSMLAATCTASTHWQWSTHR